MGRDRIGAIVRRFPWVRCASLAVALAAIGCAGPKAPPPRLAYSPTEFAAEIAVRVPDIPARLTEAPFQVTPELVERAHRFVLDAPRGPSRVEALVDFLSRPEPEGLGLTYDWSTTASAERTLELGRGNCVSLASLLVALGRGLGWPIFYAEARTRSPETQQFEAVKAMSDHMVVLVVPESFQMVIDFTGLLDELEDLRVIDDVTAYAHILNNMSAQQLMVPGEDPDEEAWEKALEGFRLATLVQPELGRAWNNMGIALTRLGRYEEARAAYDRAVELRTAFGSAQHNLTVMETRVLGEATIRPAELKPTPAGP